MAEYLAAGAAGLGALSNIQSGRTAANNSRLNAKMLDQQAKQTALQTGSQVAQVRNQGNQILGQQTAGFADNGTGTGGTNALIQRSTAIDTEMDAANADYNGRSQIAAMNTEASSLRAQAKAQQPGLLSLLGGTLGTLSAYSKAGGTFGSSSKK